jgi:hypothetical protein
MPTSTEPGVDNAKVAPTIPPSMTLRGLLDARRNMGKTMSIDEAMSVLVPICLDLQKRHEAGETLFVHPACIAPGHDGLAAVSLKLAVFPEGLRDQHCLAPEIHSTRAGGDAHASVYAVGAILYEMVTGGHVGPGMARPRDVDPGIPEALELLVEKAIISDRAHRPSDLAALASELYALAPAHSIRPPDRTSSFDASAELEVDVRFSVMPPSVRPSPLEPAIPRAAAVPRIDVGDPFGRVVERKSSNRPRRNDPTSTLAELKARLEADPRPRYIVNREHMDHGPFTAVELLQQIAGNAFVQDDVLRDTLGGEARPIKAWEEFAPFAHQVGLKRELVAEEKAVGKVVQAERKGRVFKLVGSLLLVGALAAGLSVWFFTKKGTRRESVGIVVDEGPGSVDVGGIRRRGPSSRARGAGGGVAGVGSSGGAASAPAGASGAGGSFESALESSNDEMTMGQSGAPDLTKAQLAGPLGRVSFISACGAPDDMRVIVQVAVQNGRAVGVTVSTNPPNPSVAGCVAAQVRSLSWPSNPKRDFVTMTY